jgi:hypothetical protein
LTLIGMTVTPFRFTSVAERLRHLLDVRNSS